MIQLLGFIKVFIVGLHESINIISQKSYAKLTVRNLSRTLCTCVAVHE